MEMAVAAASAVVAAAEWAVEADVAAVAAARAE